MTKIKMNSWLISNDLLYELVTNGKNPLITTAVRKMDPMLGLKPSFMVIGRE